MSGISEIVVLHNEMEIGRIQGGEGSVTISPPFYGAVDAYAVDRAGNKSRGAAANRQKFYAKTRLRSWILYCGHTKRLVCRGSRGGCANTGTSV